MGIEPTGFVVVKHGKYHMDFESQEEATEYCRTVRFLSQCENSYTVLPNNLFAERVTSYANRHKDA